MRKYLLAVLTVVIILALSLSTGCTSVDRVRVTNIVADAATVSILYKANDPIGIITQAPLTPEEETVVINSLIQIEESRDTLEELAKSPERLVTEFDSVYVEYSKIRLSYIHVRNIVIANFDKYTPADRERFLTFDGSVIDLEREFLSLYDAIERDKTIQKGIGIANIVIKTAALL